MICLFWCQARPNVNMFVGLSPSTDVVDSRCGDVSLPPCPSMLLTFASNNPWCFRFACALLSFLCRSQSPGPNVYGPDTSLNTCHFLTDRAPARRRHHTEAMYVVTLFACYAYLWRAIVISMAATTCSRALHEAGIAHLVGVLLSRLWWLTVHGRQQDQV